MIRVALFMSDISAEFVWCFTPNDWVRAAGSWHCRALRAFRPVPARVQRLVPNRLVAFDDRVILRSDGPRQPASDSSTPSSSGAGRTQLVDAGIITCSCAWEKREIVAEHGCGQDRARHGGTESTAVTSPQCPADLQKDLTQRQGRQPNTSYRSGSSNPLPLVARRCASNQHSCRSLYRGTKTQSCWSATDIDRTASSRCEHSKLHLTRCRPRASVAPWDEGSALRRAERPQVRNGQVHAAGALDVASV